MYEKNIVSTLSHLVQKNISQYYKRIAALAISEREQTRNTGILAKGIGSLTTNNRSVTQT